MYYIHKLKTKKKVGMHMFNKKWFQFLIGAVLVALLVLLLSKTSFIFYPILQYITAVAVPIVGAGILFYVTKPIVALLEKIKFPRILAIFTVFLLITAVGTIFVLFIAPIIEAQFAKIVSNIPKVVQMAQDFISNIQSGAFAIPDQVYEAIDGFVDNLQDHAENIFTSAFGIIANIIVFIMSLILIPFFLFFMLKDGDKLIPFITQAFDDKKSKNITQLLTKINETLTAFIQGQLFVSFVLGILLFIGYVIIGLNYSLTLALIGMVLNVIPFLGPWMAVVPALIVGAIQDPLMIIWVGVITLIAQQLESTFISPNVMGRALKLHPLTVITVILAAGSIAGFLGILFAVPFYAVMKTIYVHFYHTIRDSKSNKAFHVDEQ